MKRRSYLLLIALSILIAFSLMSCARKMSDADYEKISEDYTEEFFQRMMARETTEMDLEQEDYAYLLLDEVAQRSGYDADTYLKKAEELGEDWDDIYDRIDARINQEYQRMLQQMEEEDITEELEK
ncbi:MAG: hypothetical protein K0B81_06550 [Candidatus Cloacimonetes bacterium]|nr:hypothetical protein [Candidatus Cloacimonadota bacterium]